MVRLMEPVYEVHTDPRQCAFDRKSVKAFDKFMHDKALYDATGEVITYWDICRREWFRANYETPKKDREILMAMTEVPDYSKLPTVLPKR